MTLEVYKFLFVLTVTISTLGFIILRNKSASWKRCYEFLLKLEEDFNDATRLKLAKMQEQIEARNDRLASLGWEIKRIQDLNKQLTEEIKRQNEETGDALKG
ncbi:DNA helicase [Escherichia phage ECBP2]|uniref:Uncharacterized protein n=1 Tax=Escherichia phage ECBP2 TaxID=1604355 RepID=J9SH67_9CAUD|nr:DNA helicase [Escherichia phage ECBP2]AFR52146.1 hypothetical protein ECBP2_0113 [Escherichia phage ECBP2]